MNYRPFKPSNKGLQVSRHSGHSAWMRKRNGNPAITLIFLVIISVVLAMLYGNGVSFSKHQMSEITIGELPIAFAMSFTRLMVSYLWSLVFAFFFGILAAKTETGERIILPFLDIAQSLPIVCFFPAVVSIFIHNTSESRWGIEAAALLLIFTCQAWNMAFAVYEAVKSIPQATLDAVLSFGVTGSQRFWRLYAPASVPRLIFNSLLSWSNGWFFLVSAEIIAVGSLQYELPGIGSFLSKAAEQNNLRLIFAGLAVLTVGIVLMDLILWRPLTAWSSRFSYESIETEETFRSLELKGPIADFGTRLRPVFTFIVDALSKLVVPFEFLILRLILPVFWDVPVFLFHKCRNAYDQNARLKKFVQRRMDAIQKWAESSPLIFVAVLGVLAGVLVTQVIQSPLPPIAKRIPFALLKSTLRIVTALVVSFAIALPISLYTWDRPKFRKFFTTLSQVGASVPAIALFPLLLVTVVQRLGGGIEMTTMMMLFTGMFWYVMFNGLGGIEIVPRDLAEVAKSFGLKRITLFKQIIIPSMRPALVTGLITAWGGGWNTLVVSEFVRLNEKTYSVDGIGALISESVFGQNAADTRSMTICVFALVLWILLINTLFWQPLYRSTVERYKLDVE